MLPDVRWSVNGALMKRVPKLETGGSCSTMWLQALPPLLSDVQGDRPDVLKAIAPRRKAIKAIAPRRKAIAPRKAKGDRPDVRE